MTSFEKTYLIYFFTRLDCILSNKDELEKAINSYTQGNESPSYLHNSKIHDATQWSSQDILRLNAAIFEAHAQATIKLCSKPELTQQVTHVTQHFHDYYLPLITKITDPLNRLSSIKNNIKLINIEPRKPSGTIAEHPYAFFTLLTASAVIATAAVLFKSGKGTGY
ncbi:MAG: hypothetical protein PSV35_10445 [bacterium]|nr:hypothetical protein [bacterium]